MGIHRHRILHLSVGVQASQHTREHEGVIVKVDWCLYKTFPLGLPVADPSAALGDLHTSKTVLSNKGCEMTIAARP